MSETAAKVGADIGKIDILVHSLANGPEVQVRCVCFVCFVCFLHCVRFVCGLCAKRGAAWVRATQGACLG